MDGILGDDRWKAVAVLMDSLPHQIIRKTSKQMENVCFNLRYKQYESEDSIWFWWRLFGFNVQKAVTSFWMPCHCNANCSKCNKKFIECGKWQYCVGWVLNFNSGTVRSHKWRILWLSVNKKRMNIIDVPSSHCVATESIYIVECVIVRAAHTQWWRSIKFDLKSLNRIFCHPFVAFTLLGTVDGFFSHLNCIWCTVYVQWRLLARLRAHRHRHTHQTLTTCCFR